jgi:hypothetical protein
VARVGLAVDFDVPSVVQVGQAGVNGTLTIMNASTGAQANGTAEVSDITLTLACRANVVSAACPLGAEEPGAFVIDSPAIGRTGTACAGTVFKVNVIDPPAGEVMFTPPEGFVRLGPRNGASGESECVIDFTFNVNALPAQDSVSGAVGGNPARTTVHAGAAARAPDSDRGGSGANWRTFMVLR